MQYVLPFRVGSVSIDALRYFDHPIACSFRIYPCCQIKDPPSPSPTARYFRTAAIPLPRAKVIPCAAQVRRGAVLVMASIPVTSFSAAKIREHVKSKQNQEETSNGHKLFRYNLFGLDQVLPNYNSKLMNSIWGQYNLYASHAFQKNSEGSAHLGAGLFGLPQEK
ncbi:uncharacterized protein LOC129232831 [Uloborus diversus]|uniref:uncharacterized protein LOC129232831 n=1 Tax=Uloborus diversus TaxID=327109 RepID=UPI002409B7A0|nr:uncharacterized protein LOC129232831 [Uloborus diversus]